MTEARPRRAGYVAVTLGYALAIGAVLVLSCWWLSAVSATGPCGSGGTVLLADTTITVSTLTLLIVGAIATFVIMSRRERRAVPLLAGNATARGLGIGLVAALPVAGVTYFLASVAGTLHCFN